MTGFEDNVLKIVWGITVGKVATYGQVAELAGRPGAARQVRNLLRSKGFMDDVPWQRVINASGGISTYKLGIEELQKEILKDEGVLFDGERVNLNEWQWIPD